MEKKITQRIIGILIVIALAIILLPLLVDKKDPPAIQAAAITEPAFPQEDAVPVENPTVINSTTVADKVEETPKIESSTVDNSKLESPPLQTSTQSDAVVIPQQKTNATKPSSNTSPVSPSPDSSSITLSQADIAKDIVKLDEAPKSSVMEVKSHTVSENKVKAKEKTIKTVTAHTQHKTFSKFKKAVWAIQLGSFKNKDAALHLADKLRAAGYQAFMREMNSEGGASMRTGVYIGPQFKQAAAVKLSTELEKRMHLRGIVVAYEPLEL